MVTKTNSDISSGPGGGDGSDSHTGVLMIVVAMLVGLVAVMMVVALVVVV